MAEVQVGDKVTVVGGSPADRIYTVWGVHEKSVWLDSAHTTQGWIALADKVTKVEPFFEKGKTYADGGSTFECEKVLADEDGQRVALGKYRSADDERWAHELLRYYRGWAEEA